RFFQNLFFFFFSLKTPQLKITKILNSFFFFFFFFIFFFGFLCCGCGCGCWWWGGGGGWWVKKN
ncbi:hypothetical protein ACSTIV_00430, partial [Vibrio parahaemolyticus]